MPAPRILLADDDADLAAILAQRLRQAGLEVEVVTDGEQAVRAVEASVGKLDLAILDYHMPGLTGAEACARIRASGRALPVILLTSVSEKAVAEKAMQAGVTAYVLKPPRVEDLLIEIRRLTGTSPEEVPAEPLSPKLAGLLDRINTLPAMPVTTQKLLDVLNNPAAGAKELSRVITLDPAVTAQVLRLANSAYYGQQGKISDVTKAVILIGFAEISHALMALSLASLFVVKGKADVLDRAAFWEHALGCSVMAGHLARRAGVEDPNQAVIAGLLHDLGKLVLATYLPEEYGSLLKRAVREGRPLREMERELLGDNHALLGEALAQRWKLPPTISRCIRYHHVPLSAEAMDHATVSLVRVVSAADALAKGAGLGASGDDLVEEIPERVWNLLTVDAKVAEDAVKAGRRSVAMHKAALGRQGAEPEEVPGIPALHLVETEQAVPLTWFSLQAAGYAPHLTRTWGEATAFLESCPETGLLVLESAQSPKESRFLDTVLRWRRGQATRHLLFIAPAKRLEGATPVEGVVFLPKPIGIAALKAAADAR